MSAGVEFAPTEQATTVASVSCTGQQTAEEVDLVAIKLDAGPKEAPLVPPLSSYRAKKCFEALVKDLTYDKSLKVADDAFTAAIKKMGIVKEAEIGERIAQWSDAVTILCKETTTSSTLRTQVAAAKRQRVAVIDCDDTPQGVLCAEAATHELCAHPGRVKILWNANLRSWRIDEYGEYEWGQRSGKPDVLVLTGSKSRPTWAGVDVKAHHVLEGTGAAREWKVSALTSYFERTGVKAKGPFKKDDAMQLAHYQRMLEFHGLAGPAIGGIIGTNDDGLMEDRIVWIDLEEKLYERGTVSAMRVYDEAFAEVSKIAKRTIERKTRKRKPALSRAEWKAECKTCPWRVVCHEECVAADDTTLLPGVSVPASRSLRAAGVDTVEQLAHLDLKTAAVLAYDVLELQDIVVEAKRLAAKRQGHLTVLHACSDTTAANRLVEAGITTVAQAAELCETTAGVPLSIKGQLSKYIDQARVTDYARRSSKQHLFLARSVDKLEIPRGVVEYHVDMEEDGIIYMWGVRTETRNEHGVTHSYRPFVTFDHTEVAEAEVFVEFWTWLQDRIEQAHTVHGPDGVKVYHYTAAEDRCMKHLAKTNAGFPGMPTLAEVEAFCESPDWVDLHPILSKQVLWPTEDHTLKSLAKYIRFMWRDTDPSGANSQVWYRNARDMLLSAEEREEWRKRLIEYNEDDVIATAKLLEFFHRFNEVRDPKGKLSSVTVLDSKYR